MAVLQPKQIMFGNPLNDEHQPDRVEMAAWMEFVQSVIISNAGDVIWREEFSDISSDLGHGANTVAFVFADNDPSNNGVYNKIGTSGAGSWNKVIDFIPGFQFINAIDDGNSSASAYKLTASPAAPSEAGQTLVSFIVPQTSDSEDVTVGFNGGVEYPIKISSGSNPVAGGLVAGMAVLGVVQGGVFKMYSDQASSAIQTAAAQSADDAEQARDEAKQARDATQGFAAAVEGFPRLNRAALLAADPELFPVVWLEDGNKSGMFRAVTGNQSAKVGEDPAGAVWIPGNDVSNGSQGAFKRHIEGRGVSPYWWGVVFDVVLDGNAFAISGTDNAPAINQMNVWTSNKWGNESVVEWPRERCGVRSPIVMLGAQEWLGQGLEQTWICMLPGFTGVQLFQFPNISGAVPYFRNVVKSIKLVSEGMSSTKFGFTGAGARDCLFEDCFFDRFNQGLRWLGAGYYMRCDRCTFFGSIVTGVRTFSAANQAPNEISFHNCRINRGANGFEYLTSAAPYNSIKMYNCSIEDHTGLAVRVAGAATGPKLASNIVLEDIRVDSPTANGAGSFSLDQYTSAVIRNDFISGVSDIVDNAVFGNIKYSGLRHEIEIRPNIAWASAVAPDSTYTQIITMNGYRAGKWSLGYPTYDFGGLNSDIFVSLRGRTNNECQVDIRNRSNAPLPAGSFPIILTAKRIKT